MTAGEMIKRALVIAGEYFENVEPTISLLDEDEDFERLVVTDSEGEDENSSNDGLAQASDARREAFNTLIYNDSDQEDSVSVPTPVKQTEKNGKQKPKAKINIFDMIKNNADDESKENKENDENNKNNETNDFEIDSEDIRGRLAELQDSDGSDTEHNQTIKKVTNVRKRITIVDSDTDSDNDGGVSKIKANAKMQDGSQDAGESQDFSSQSIRSRLAELDDSDSDDDMNQLPANKNAKLNTSNSSKRQTIIDTDESSNGATSGGLNDSASQSSKKRERSDSEHSSDDQMMVTKKKRPSNAVQRNAIDNSDDDN